MKLVVRGTEIDLPPPRKDRGPNGIDPELVRLVIDPSSGVRMDLALADDVTILPDGDVGFDLIPSRIYIDDPKPAAVVLDTSSCECGCPKPHHSLKVGWLTRCEDCGEACRAL
jgi:hypothetical protein